MRILVFGTVYAGDLDKAQIARLWYGLHGSVNPDCEFALVDSASPYPVPSDGVQVIQLGDNIGHLGRGGLDGWGRAFCVGLQHGLDQGFDYVVHVEGDSLLRRSVREVCAAMHAKGVGCSSVPVRGTKRAESNWVETGLMFFSAEYLRRCNLIGRYQWQDCEPKRRYPHCPEWHVHQLVRRELRMLNLSAERNDVGQITTSNVGNYDWVTHVSPRVASEFVRSCDPVVH